MQIPPWWHPTLGAVGGLHREGLHTAHCTLTGWGQGNLKRESLARYPESTAIKWKLKLILIVSPTLRSPGQGVASSESESTGGVALTALFKQNQLR